MSAVCWDTSFGSRFISGLSSRMARNSGHKLKHRKIHLNIRKKMQGRLNTKAGSPERHSLYIWRCSNPDWIQCSVSSCSWPFSELEVEQDLKRCFLVSATLSFCGLLGWDLTGYACASWTSRPGDTTECLQAKLWAQVVLCQCAGVFSSSSPAGTSGAGLAGLSLNSPQVLSKGCCWEIQA